MVLVFASMIVSSIVTRYYFKETFQNDYKGQIQRSITELVNLSSSSNVGEDEFCDFINNYKSESRLSLISLQGKVVCDNFANPSSLDNHKNRDEIIQAKDAPFGFSIRESSTLNQRMIYGAQKINLGKKQFFIRKSLPFKKLDETITLIDRSIFIIIIPIFIFLVLFSINRSRKFAAPLSSLLEKFRFLASKNSKGEISSSIEDLDEAFEKVRTELTDYIENLHLENEKNAVLVQSISDGILAIDENGHILFMNDNFKQSFLPIYFEQDLEGMDLSNALAWEYVRNIQIENSFKEILDNPNATPVTTSIEVLKRNNQKGFYDLIVSPLRGVKGNKLGAMGVFRDESNKRLTDQMRTDFVTNVSHEVRTPLTAMKGFIQIIGANSDDLKPEIKNYLERIEQNCDRLIRLFNDVLNLSVINSKALIDRDEIIPSEIVNSVVTNVRQSYRDKKVEVVKDITSSVFFGESLLIEQVATNLIDNAFKYNSVDGAIKVSWHDDENNSILKVEDSGIGIKKKHYPRLFERFYRIDPSRSREMGGTGLGLAIVKHIVLKHSGKIEISESDLGGSAFTVTFPIIAKKEKLRFFKK